MVKTRVEDRNLYSPFESLGLRYLVQFGMEKESRTHNIASNDSITNARRICVSNLAMTIVPVAKELGSRQLKNNRINDVDHVVQRPRAVLSSPDNDHLIGEMNKKASKRGSKPRTHGGRFNSARVDVEDAHIRIRVTNLTYNTQNRLKIKD